MLCIATKRLTMRVRLLGRSYASASNIIAGTTSMAKQISFGSMFVGRATSPGSEAAEERSDSLFRILLLANLSGGRRIGMGGDVGQAERARVADQQAEQSPALRPVVDGIDRGPLAVAAWPRVPQHEGPDSR